MFVLVVLCPSFKGDFVGDFSVNLSESDEEWLVFGALMFVWLTVGTIAEAAAKRSKTSVGLLLGVNVVLAVAGELGLAWSRCVCGYQRAPFGGEFATIGLTFGTTLWGLAWLKQWAYVWLDLRVDSPGLVRLAPLVICLGLPLVFAVVYMYAHDRAMGGQQ